MIRQAKKSHGYELYMTCDARKGKGICANVIDLTLPTKEMCNAFAFRMGWRLLRGHQVCHSCAAKPRITFPRTTTEASR